VGPVVLLGIPVIKDLSSGRLAGNTRHLDAPPETSLTGRPGIETGPNNPERQQPHPTGKIEAQYITMKDSLLTTRGRLLWLYRSLRFMCSSCILSPDQQGAATLVV